MPIAWRQTLATSFVRLQECYPQRFVRTHNMLVGTPPLQMDQQLWRLLRRRPAATSQCGYAMTNGQIDSFNESGVESA